VTAQPPPPAAGVPQGVQVQPAPLSYAWADWGGPAQPDGTRPLLGAILRLDTLYGKVYGFWEPPGLAGFLRDTRRQLLRLPGGEDLAAQALTSGILLATELPPSLPPNGQPR
jgi:hypothetical protein